MPRTEEQIQELVREMYTTAESSDWELKPETIRSQRGQRRVPLPDVKVLVLVAAAVILIVVGIVVANGSISHRPTVSGPSSTTSTLSGGQSVTVPNGVGESQTQVATALGSAGLKVGPINLVANGSVKAGLVISENPQPGSVVSPGSLVSLTVSTGPSPVKVPNVVALAETEAANVLGSAGLNVGTITQEANTHFPVGWVVGQTPSSGTLAAPGSPVDLVVSTGP
jgi:hypothetical protein